MPQAAGAGCLGAVHSARGQICQDAVTVVHENGLVVATVADGHGHHRHARSDEGAAIAVELAGEILSALGRSLEAEEAPPRATPTEAWLREHLPRRICWEWNQRIKAHAGFGEEADGCWHECLELYGTTLIAALFTRTLGVFIQIGDGEVTLLDEDGAILRPFPDPEQNVGAITQSLCQPAAAAHMKVACWDLEKIGPRLAALCTDGVSDAFAERPDALLPWLLSRISGDGWDPLISDLPSWLGEVSRLGNGDDTTLGLVYWPRQPERRRGRIQTHADHGDSLPPVIAPLELPSVE